MNDHGTVLDPAIRFQRLLPADIETVWAYLTESDKRGHGWPAATWSCGWAASRCGSCTISSSVDEPEPFRDENGVTTRVITR